jgi:hypothetical protein
MALRSGPLRILGCGTLGLAAVMVIVIQSREGDVPMVSSAKELVRDYRA